MRIGFLYFLYMILLHAGLFYLVYEWMDKPTWWIFAIELGVIFSFWIAYQLYTRFIRPINLMRQGADAIRDKDFSLQYGQTGAPETDELLGLYNETVERLRKERMELEEQHFFLDKMIEASPTGILILDYDNYITQINPSALRILQAKISWMGTSVETHPHPLLKEAMELEMGESRLIKLNGLAQYKCHVSHFIQRGFSRKFLMIEELSREFLENEKAAYGKVIRMMAHEVNNTTGAINSILQTVHDMHLEEPQNGFAKVPGVLEVAIKRNKRLTGFMKNFAEVVRLPLPKKEWQDIIALTQQVLDMLSHQHPNIELQTDFPNEPLRLQLDPAQIEQALINVIQNAFESMGESGILRCSIESSPPRLTISDNGPGIAPENAERLFTPFFSTKANGQGIGLTLVREILLNHGWSFQLETGDDGWTVFGVGMG